MTPCFFNGCANAAAPDSTKCLFHHHRGICLVDACRNQVYARNLCVRHGGKKQCQFHGCTLNSRVGSFCTKHGPTDAVRRCSHDGCLSQAHLRGKCFRHGGSRFCKVDGCVTYARNRGYCARHTPKSPATIGDFPVKLEHVDVSVEQSSAGWSCNDIFWMRQTLMGIEPLADSSNLASTADTMWHQDGISLQGWSEVMTLLAQG